jgi:hypothetical protein
MYKTHFMPALCKGILGNICFNPLSKMNNQVSTAADASDVVQPAKPEATEIELNNIKDNQDRYVGGSWDINSHHKSREERWLVTKIDLLILPLGALMYLVAYMVCNPDAFALYPTRKTYYPSSAHSVILVQLADGVMKFRIGTI